MLFLSCKPLDTGKVALIPVVAYLDVTVNSVVWSIRERVDIFTVNPKWARKSAPRLSVFTCVIVKIHENDFRRPRFNVNEVSPNVSM